MDSPFLLTFLGANILVSAFTITVIAIDRWISVTNTNPAESLTYNRVFFVIGSMWTMAFACKYLSQRVIRREPKFECYVLTKVKSPPSV